MKIEPLYPPFYDNNIYRGLWKLENGFMGGPFLIKTYFIEEKIPLGTAGSLKSLENRYKKPFIVTNCDIIINTDYNDLYKFHNNNDYDITLVASMKNYIIPYGTCELNREGFLKKINEKPIHRFFVNAGLYLFDPKVLSLLSNGKTLDMPGYFDKIIAAELKTVMFPILEEWIDIGDFNDYKRANSLYGNHIN